MDKCYSCKYLTNGSDEVYCNLSFTKKCINYERYEPKQSDFLISKQKLASTYGNIMKEGD